MSYLRYITLVLLFISLHCNVYSQFEIDGEKVSYRKWRKALAEKQIKQLQKGALFVRLQSRKKSLDLLRSKGHNEMADKYEIRQEKLNKKIVKGFEEHFNFCPVYYFYAKDSRYIKNKQFDSLNFLNKKLKEDSSIAFNSDSFLIAEFGKIAQDTIQTTDSYYYHRGEDGLERRTKYQGRPNMGFGALIIKSDQFVQLRKPFPYYVRNFNSLPIKRRTSKCVKLMNRHLKKFYEKVTD